MGGLKHRALINQIFIKYICICISWDWENKFFNERKMFIYFLFFFKSFIVYAKNSKSLFLWNKLLKYYLEFQFCYYFWLKMSVSWLFSALVVFTVLVFALGYCTYKRHILLVRCIFIISYYLFIYFIYFLFPHMVEKDPWNITSKQLTWEFFIKRLLFKRFSHWWPCRTVMTLSFTLWSR